MKAFGFPIQQNLTYPEDQHQMDIEEGNTEEIDNFTRQRARPTFHCVCSCRMARQDDVESLDVVNDELRVYGVRNLRVCDASVFPEVVSSHLQAPVVMIAERCADFMRTSM